MSLFEKYFQNIEQDTDFLAAHAIHDFTLEIHRLLEEHGMSRADLARRLGTSQAYVTKMLSGNANFTIKSMVKIAAAFGARVHIRVEPGLCGEREWTDWANMENWTPPRRSNGSPDAVWADSYEEDAVVGGPECFDEDTPVAA